MNTSNSNSQAILPYFIAGSLIFIGMTGLLSINQELTCKASNPCLANSSTVNHIAWKVRRR